MNEEILKKAKAAKSPEELIELAKANGKEITSEKAEEYFRSLSAGGELSDDELDNAVGGCGAWKPNFDCPGGGWKCSWRAASIYELDNHGWSRWACRECGNAVHTGGNNECCEHAKRYKKLDCTNCKWGAGIMNEEILKKVKAAKYPEELIGLAKAAGVEITGEQAEAFFKKLSDGEEITDEELENAIGGCGGGGNKAPRWKPQYDCNVGRQWCRWRENHDGVSIFYIDNYNVYGWSYWACKECGNGIYKAPGNYQGCEHAKQYKQLDCSNCKWG